MEIKGRHAVDRLRESMSQENMRTTLSECLLTSGFIECSRAKLVGDQGKMALKTSKILKHNFYLNLV